MLCERFLEIYSVAKFDWQTSCAFVFVGYVHVVGDRGNSFLRRQACLCNSHDAATLQKINVKTIDLLKAKD